MHVKRARLVRATMRLRAVRRSGRVVDFMWEYVGASVAPLLNCAPGRLHGRCMHELAVGPLGHPALVERYRRVLEDGMPQTFEQVHCIGGKQAIVTHCVVPLDDGFGMGVGVTLTRTTAGGRAHSAGFQVKSRPSAQVIRHEPNHDARGAVAAPAVRLRNMNPSTALEAGSH